MTEDKFAHFEIPPGVAIKSIADKTGVQATLTGGDSGSYYLLLDPEPGSSTKGYIEIEARTDVLPFDLIRLMTVGPEPHRSIARAISNSLYKAALFQEQASRDMTELAAISDDLLFAREVEWRLIDTDDSYTFMLETTDPQAVILASAQSLRYSSEEYSASVLKYSMPEDAPEGTVRFEFPRNREVWDDPALVSSVARERLRAFADEALRLFYAKDTDKDLLIRRLRDEVDRLTALLPNS